MGAGDRLLYSRVSGSCDVVGRFFAFNQFCKKYFETKTSVTRSGSGRYRTVQRLTESVWLGLGWYCNSGISPLNPSGHSMYRQFNIHNSAFCPHSVFMCFVWIWEQTAIISLYNINWLVCITETECVYCAVRTGPLYTVSLTFSNSTFCPHSVFMCFLWISEQTAIISLHNINWLVFITKTPCGVSHFLEYDVASLGIWFPTFRDYVVVLSRRVKTSKMSISSWTSNPWRWENCAVSKLSRIRSPLRQGHIPQEWIPHPRRSEAGRRNLTSTLARSQLLLWSSLCDTYACVGTAA